MASRIIGTSALLGGVVVLGAIVTRPPSPPAHEDYCNGVVLSMDPVDSEAQAVSVRDGVIEAVGRSEHLLSMVDEQTSTIDLRGRTLMPGFVDAHGHFPGSGQTVFSADLNSPPIGDIDSIAELISRLQAFSRDRPDGWIVGHGYDDTLMAERRHPTRDDLDRVSDDRPVAITHVSGHLAAVNSAALAALGMTNRRPIRGGVIVRDPASADGRRPNGVGETAARAVWDHSLDIGLADTVRMTTQERNICQWE